MVWRRRSVVVACAVIGVSLVAVVISALDDPADLIVSGSGDQGPFAAGGLPDLSYDLPGLPTGGLARRAGGQLEDVDNSIHPPVPTTLRMPPTTLPPLPVPTVPGGGGRESDCRSVWSQPYGDAGNSGTNRVECRINSSTVADLVPLWSTALYPHDTSQPDNPSAWTAIDGDRAYAVADGRLWALRTSDGHRLWVTALPARVTTGVTVVDGKAIVGADDGYFYALDSDNGTVRWRWDGIIPGEARAAVWAPAKSDGHVVILAGGGVVSAVDPESGVIRWTTTPGGRFRFCGAPAIADGTVVLTNCSAGMDEPGVLALALDTGVERWRTTVGFNVIAGAVRYKGAVFVVDSRSWITSFDGATGVKRWTVSQFESSGLSVEHPPVLTDGHLVATNAHGTTFALDALSGGVLWSQTNATRGGSGGAVTAVADVVFVQGYNSLTALALHNGERLAILGDRTTAVIAVAGESVLLAGRTDTEAVVWRYGFP